MLVYLIAYIATVIIFPLLDFAWFSVSLKTLYRPQLGSLLLEKPNLVAGALFYLVYSAGVVVLAVLPAVQQESWLRALSLGAFLGFIAYMTYDMTNLATLRDWSLLVSVLDAIWGTIATGLAATAVYFITRHFSK